MIRSKSLSMIVAFVLKYSALLVRLLRKCTVLHVTTRVVKADIAVASACFILIAFR